MKKPFAFSSPLAAMRTNCGKSLKCDPCNILNECQVVNREANDDVKTSKNHSRNQDP